MQRADDQHTADQYAWHDGVIREILACYDQGTISASEKRRLIADENARYYGPSDRLALAREMAAPDFGILHAEPADPRPYAAAIRRELGWLS